MANAWKKLKNGVRKTKIGHLLGKMYRGTKRILRRIFRQSSLARRIDIRKYLRKIKFKEVKITRALVTDIMLENMNNHWTYEEYIGFHFYEKSPEERKAFISTAEELQVYLRINPMSARPIFQNKDQTYELFKSYYKREVALFSETSSEADFAAFTERHPRFIVKPRDLYGGRGIHVYSVSDRGMTLKKLLKLYNGSFVAEELVVQHRELAKLHSQSLNTIRLATVIYPDRIDILHTFFRMGCGNCVVDNNGDHMLVASVDFKTGCITAVCDPQGRFVTAHPDTGINLIGFRIPYWEEAIAFVKELATVVPEELVIGWDIAITDNGPVMIEGNTKGGWAWQLPEKKGAREELNKLLKNLNV